MKFIKRISLLGMIAFSFVMSSCNKEKIYPTIVSAPAVHFIGDALTTYAVRSATVLPDSIGVGTTDVSNSDRIVTFKITSSTGAAAGTQYTVSGSTVTIPAGKSIAYIPIQGLLAGYPAGRIDTLTVTLAPPSLTVAAFSDTVKIVVGDICTEGQGFDVTSFVGPYNTCFDTQAGSPDYGPYTMTFLTVVPLTATTANVTIDNFWDVGGPPITVTLDWSATPLTITIPAQPLYTDPTYGPATITGVGTSTFSSCNNTFKFSYKVTVAAGSFGSFITNVAR